MFSSLARDYDSEFIGLVWVFDAYKVPGIWQSSHSYALVPILLNHLSPTVYFRLPSSPHLSDMLQVLVEFNDTFLKYNMAYN